jgi:hypothetical protein
MKKTNIIIAALLFASATANVVLIHEARQPAEVKVETRTEYVTVRDTVPTFVQSHLTGETIKMTAVHRHATNHEPDVMAAESLPDTVASVCIVGDSATVTLPVEQRVYQDSLYTAYVSGYRPRLDSILLRLPHTYTTATRTVNKAARRWAVGPTVGAGYGIVGKQADLFVGVSVTWNLLP